MRSIRPSGLLILYLTLSLIFDVARCRTLWGIQSGETAATVLSVTIGFKAVLFILEAVEKRAFLLPKYQGLPPEATAGELNIWFTWWLNPILLRGFKKHLSMQTLFDVDPGLKASEEDDGLVQAWKQCECSSPILLVIKLCPLTQACCALYREMEEDERGPLGCLHGGE